MCWDWHEVSHSHKMTSPLFESNSCRIDGFNVFHRLSHKNNRGRLNGARIALKRLLIDQIGFEHKSHFYHCRLQFMIANFDHIDRTARRAKTKCKAATMAALAQVWGCCDTIDDDLIDWWIDGIEIGRQRARIVALNEALLSWRRELECLVSNRQLFVCCCLVNGFFIDRDTSASEGVASCCVIVAHLARRLSHCTCKKKSNQNLLLSQIFIFSFISHRLHCHSLFMAIW